MIKNQMPNIQLTDRLRRKKIFLVEHNNPRKSTEKDKIIDA